MLPLAAMRSGSRVACGCVVVTDSAGIGAGLAGAAFLSLAALTPNAINAATTSVGSAIAMASL